MTLLIWKEGGDPYPGWPASDHEEPDPVLCEWKLASRLYRTADDKEDAVAKAEAKAAKAQANASAAKAAKEEAERARAAEERAAALRADREANLGARLAAARATLKEVEGGTD